MSVNAWTPTTPDQQVDPEPLKKFIQLAESEATLSALTRTLTAEEIENNRYLMSLPQQKWQPLLEDFTTDELQLLIKFFTLAEMQLPGWDAGEKSPVIWIVKLLRKKHAPLSKEQLLWIKNHSTNRFLPNGPL